MGKIYVKLKESSPVEIEGKLRIGEASSPEDAKIMMVEFREKFNEDWEMWYEDGVEVKSG